MLIKSRKNLGVICLEQVQKYGLVFILGFVFFLFLIPNNCKAFTVKGVVYGKNECVLPGATVMVYSFHRDTTYGTITGIDGDFWIQCGYDDFLKISFVGYKNQGIIIRGDSTINVQLVPELHYDGYKRVVKHSLTGFTNYPYKNYILEYLWGFRGYDRNEIGRKPIHAFVKPISIGLSYLKNEHDNLFPYMQLKYKLPMWRVDLNVYSNIGAQYTIGNSAVKFRTDVGLAVQIFKYKKFGIAINSRLVAINNEPKFFFGIALRYYRYYASVWNY